MNHTHHTSPTSAPKSKCRSFLPGLNRWPLLRHLISPVREENMPDSPPAALAPHPPESDVPHVSPHFLKGMELGEQMFAIAAVYAHAKRHRLACRIPWAHSRTSKALRRALRNICIPGTSGDTNEPIVYREHPSSRYSPIPERIQEGALKGYFHSPLYFADKEKEIRRLFSSLVAERTEPGTVGVYVNVGEGPFQHSKFRLASCYYLMRAAAYIPHGTQELTVFSETPAQAVSLLVEIPEFSRFSFRVERLNSFAMLRRMSEMQHLITSVDSLSWWAAWLGKPSQVVVPNFWYILNGNSLPNIPGSSWVKI